MILCKTHTCPRCVELSSWLASKGIELEVLWLDEPAGLAEARSLDIFVREAPALLVGNVLLTANMLFKGGKLNEEGIMEHVGGKA